MMKAFSWLMCASIVLVGCAGTQEVKPWEKETLAKDIM